MLDELHRLMERMPGIAWVFIVVALASMGLPGFSGFVSELYVLLGAWAALPTWIVITAGVGVLATFGKPAAGIRCATAIREAVRTLGLEIRIGLHAGEYKVSGAEVIGLAFHIGARVAAKAGLCMASTSAVLPNRRAKRQSRLLYNGFPLWCMTHDQDGW